LRKRMGGGLSYLTGNSPAIGQLRQALDKVAPTDSRVLISGMPGTGKSIVARLLHDRSQRFDGPFIDLNCAGLEPGRLELALFGREATNREARMIGVLEQAHGGTLLLDEVADMPPETQGKIVRVLHKPNFQRLGSDGWVEVDVRVVATTSRDLKTEIEEGRFREDLYYRLNVVPLMVPPLNDRRADIPLLAQDLMRRAAAAKGRPPKPLSEDALVSLQAYEWPGNVWELENVIERLFLPNSGDADVPVSADDVAEAIGKSSPDFLQVDASLGIMNQPLREAREAFERKYLAFHLARFGGNISRTAGFVGMDRAALHRKLKGLGVHNSERTQSSEQSQKSEQTQKAGA
jgi:two-component system nitrogen regulation response regulator NtrX